MKWWSTSVWLLLIPAYLLCKRECFLLRLALQILHNQSHTVDSFQTVLIYNNNIITSEAGLQIWFLVGLHNFPVWSWFVTWVDEIPVDSPVSTYTHLNICHMGPKIISSLPCIQVKTPKPSIRIINSQDIIYPSHFFYQILSFPPL